MWGIPAKKNKLFLIYCYLIRLTLKYQYRPQTFSKISSKKRKDIGCFFPEHFKLQRMCIKKLVTTITLSGGSWWIASLWPSKKNKSIKKIFSPAGWMWGVGPHWMEVIRFGPDKKSTTLNALVHPRCHHSMLMSHAGDLKVSRSGDGETCEEDKKNKTEKIWRRRGEMATVKQEHVKESVIEP